MDARRMSMLVLPAVAVVAIIACWQLVVEFLHPAPYILPAPAEVVDAFGNYKAALWSGVKATTYETLVGFALATVVGIGVALLFRISSLVRRALYPLVVGCQAVPKIAVAPLFIVWLGETRVLSKILMVFLISFFPIVLNTIIGFDSVETKLFDLMRSMGARRHQVVVKLEIPAVMPQIFAGLEIAVTLAVVGAIVGELVGGNQGLGYLMNVAAGNVDTALMFADMIVLTVMAAVLFFAVEGIGRLVVRRPIESATALATAQ